MAKIDLLAGVTVPAKFQALVRLLQSEGYSYGLGAKITPIDQEGPDIVARNEAGAPCHELDCSGFVRWCLYHSTGTLAPDGSVDQHAWCTTQGFTSCPVADGHKIDGLVRVAFLTPEASGEGIGHVMLLCNGYTFESHGGKGPDSRAWGSAGFMARCEMYVLTESA